MHKIISKLNILSVFGSIYKKTKIYFANNILIVSIISIIYLIFCKSTVILYSIYGLIIILAILLHILVIKNYNIKFDDTLQQSINKQDTNSSFIVFLSKMLFLQGRIFLISNWLISNLLSQSKLNQQFNGIVTNILPEHNVTLLVNGFISWIVFVSLLLGVGFYKYNFKFSNIRLAKCLFPNAEEQPSISLYNNLLVTESYVRIMSFIVLTTVLLVNIFENISVQYNLSSFFEYPMITSFIIMLVFIYSNKNLENTIDFLAKKQSMGFLSVFAIVFLMFSVIIFIFNQLLLSQIEFLKIIHQNNLPNHSYILSMLLADPNSVKQRLIILLVGLNIMLTFGATTDIFLKHIAYKKTSTIYFASCFFPIIYSILCYKFNFDSILNDFLTTNIANYLMLLFVFAIFKINYKDIYHILCVFGLKENIVGKSPQSIKIDFSLVVKSIITTNFFCLSGYYLFAWIFTEHVVGLGSVLILPVIAMLIIKILWQNKLSRFKSAVIQ